MTQIPKRYTVTSALPYANGPLHIGHMAGAILPADIYSRFLRSMGKDVIYVCGSDENGAAITVKALKEGKTPEEITNHYHELFKDSFEKFDISFDVYSRTSSKIHHETSQNFFRDLLNDSKLTSKTSEQYYDPEAKQFLADRYISGTCPKCDYDQAYGDQCENCGSTLSPEELINPKSKLSGAKPEKRSTSHWYLPLNQLEPWLRKWITEGKDDKTEHHDPKEWKTHVLGQCRSWIDQGLKERAMTRDLDWGVDVPQEIEGSAGKKLYVWLDAPIGYISATKEWSQTSGKDWKPYWKDQDTELTHFIGKDNIVFHCLIFPSILKSVGGFILPSNVPANQFLNLEGKKISTSRNWAIWMHEYIAENPEMLEELRYYLIKIMPEQKDSEFTWSGFQDAVNGDLVNNLANFTNRVMVLCNKYYDGIVPEIDPDQPIYDHEGEMTFMDSELLTLHDMMQEVHEEIRKFSFRSALKKIFEISQRGNQLLQGNEPWKIVKTEPEKVKVLMNICLQYMAGISLSLKSFLPNTSAAIMDLLKIKDQFEQRTNEHYLDLLAEGMPLVPSSHAINEPKHLFNRITDEWIETQRDKLKTTNTEEEKINYASLAENIDFGDFMKLDLRIGSILNAEKMEKADKLLKLEIDLGFEKRTIVSGIAKHYQADQLPGKQVVIVANLAPKKLRGVMSNGMILMAENQEGKLCFVSPESKWMNGAEVK